MEETLSDSRRKFLYIALLSVSFLNCSSGQLITQLLLCELSIKVLIVNKVLIVSSSILMVLVLNLTTLQMILLLWHQISYGNVMRMKKEGNLSNIRILGFILIFGNLRCLIF